MKTVFDNAQCAHVWAQQTQLTGRSNSMRFDGRVIYSYQTPIACFAESVAGARVALVTSNTYSWTTSCRHMPAVWSAIRGTRSFSVPHVYAPDGAIHGEYHASNLAYLVAEYEKAKVSLMRARDYRAERLALTGNRARAYADTFGLPRPAMDVDADIAAIAAHHAVRQAKASTPAGIARRAKAAAAREVIAKKAREVNRFRYAESIAGWQSGRLDYLSSDARDSIGAGALLRVKGDELQTSHGARVPLDHAIKVFQFVQLVRARGCDWERNGKTLRVGHFQVDRILPNGDFYAGCHFIEWSETARLAERLGLLDIAPADTTESSAQAA